MGLFGRKKKVEAEVAEEKKVTTEVKTKDTQTGDQKPATSKKYSYRVTEKATKLGEKNVFVLNVPLRTNKTELKKELAKKYKVTVLGINMVNIAKKAKFYRGRKGMKGGGKKAYITLKPGENIVL